MEEVPTIVADDLTDAQVKAFRIADNKVSDFSIWDNKLLLEELSELHDFDIFTGFEMGDLFDNVLDVNDNDVLVNNDTGVIYEIVFKSEDKDKIDSIIKEWEKISGEHED